MGLLCGQLYYVFMASYLLDLALLFYMKSCSISVKIGYSTRCYMFLYPVRYLQYLPEPNRKYRYRNSSVPSLSRNRSVPRSSGTVFLGVPRNRTDRFGSTERPGWPVWAGTRMFHSNSQNGMGSEIEFTSQMPSHINTRQRDYIYNGCFLLNRLFVQSFVFSLLSSTYRISCHPILVLM
jgi:hypothetical protein